MVFIGDYLVFSVDHLLYFVSWYLQESESKTKKRKMGKRNNITEEHEFLNNELKEKSMDFIGSCWWLWLIIMVISGAYVINSQIKRMKRISSGSMELFKGDFGSFVTAGVISTFSGALLLLSVVINLIAYFKA